MLTTMFLSVCLIFVAYFLGILWIDSVCFYVGLYTSLAGIPISIVLGIIEWMKPGRRLLWPIALLAVSVIPEIFWVWVQATSPGGD
jgi:hypothetical protein